MTTDLTVIVPAYNESKTIGVVIERLIKNLQSVSFEILVIDDASKDNTAEIVSNFGKTHSEIHLIQHKVNQGKTMALATGFKKAQGKAIIVQDADLEYCPEDIISLVLPILEGDADVVYGSRMIKYENKEHFMLRSYFANKLITFVSNLFTKYKFTDVETCYKAFKSEIIQNLIITSQQFGFEIEVTAKISKLELNVCEKPISFASRSYQEGKKIGVRDGFQALGYILKYNLFTSKENSFTQDPTIAK
jgi:Glycosyltransferases involved in cell wall biogenesis